MNASERLLKCCERFTVSGSPTHARINKDAHNNKERLVLCFETKEIFQQKNNTTEKRFLFTTSTAATNKTKR